MTAIFLTENISNTVIDQLMIVAVIIIVLLIAWAFMRYTTILFKYLGFGGASIISRVMRMILCSVAVTHLLEGISAYFEFG